METGERWAAIKWRECSGTMCVGVIVAVANCTGAGGEGAGPGEQHKWGRAREAKIPVAQGGRAGVEGRRGDGRAECGRRGRGVQTAGRHVEDRVAGGRREMKGWRLSGGECVRLPGRAVDAEHKRK